MGLLFIFIAQVAGILISSVRPEIPWYACVCMAAAVLCTLVLSKNAVLWLFAISCITFMISAKLCPRPSVQCAEDVLSSAGHSRTAVAGWVTDYVEEYPDREKIIVRIDELRDTQGTGIPAGRGCVVQIFAFVSNSSQGHLLRGDYVRAVVRLREPKNLNNPGSYDYRRALARRGIGLIAYVSTRDDIAADAARARTGLRRSIDRVRLLIKDVILRNIRGQAASGIVTALVIGDQGYISRDIRRMFASTGIIHILVVAGLHLAIITHLCYLLIKFVLSRFRYLCIHANIPKLSLSMSLVPMLAYIFISGANAPVVRSGSMIVVYCVLFLMNRTRARWTGILIAGIFILTMDPLAVFSISFQLSFTAVASLIAFMPVIGRMTAAGIRSIQPRWLQAVSGHVLGMLLVSLFVTIGLCGVIAFYFNTIPLFGVLLNLIVIPFFCYLVLPLSLLSSAAGVVLPAVSHYLFMIVSLLLHCIVFVISHVSNLSVASIRIPTPTVFEIFLYYAGLIVLLNVRRMGPKAAFSLLSVIVLFTAADIGFFVSKNNFDKKLRITFIDVGQGDSSLIEFPSGKTMLIDAGGSAYSSFDTGEAVIARYLWSLKRRTIDYVVSSHPQEDHMAGLGFIIRTMDVKKVYASDCAPETEVYRGFMDAVRSSGAVLSTVTGTAQTFTINGVEIRLFSVPHDACDAARKKDINNDAVLVRLTYKKVSLLLTGDIEKVAEYALVETYGDALSSTIMKAPHHGSATSSTGRFIDAVGPGIVVVPVGKDNPFRMPSKAVLRRLFRRNIRVLRTDRNGAITIVTDGDGITIKTYLDNSSA